MAVRQITSIEDITLKELESKSVIVEESPIYPGQLVLLADDQKQFKKQFNDFVSRFHVLKELSLYDAFLQEAEIQGYNVFLMPSAVSVLSGEESLSDPLEIKGFTIPNGGKLFRYQQYGIRKALSMTNNQRYMFFNWGTGSGKSLAAAAGAQELIINRKDFDIALVFTLRKIKGGLARIFTTMTELNTRIIDGTKEYRTREYAKADADVYVMNYEKAFHDFEQIKELIKGKRVIFVFDEVQRILVWADNKPTRAAKHINLLVRSVRQRVTWPMSASIINHDPARWWRNFQWLPEHPLGLLGEFRSRYQLESSTVWKGANPALGKRGYPVRIEVWDERKLEDVRHRVAAYSHAVRKTDPGVRELFKGIQFEPVPVEMSDTDREIYNVLRGNALDFRDENDYASAGGMIHLMKMVCNTSEALLHTSSDIPDALLDLGLICRENLKTSLSAKFEVVLEKIMEIEEQGDKVVLFTKYTNLGLFLLAKELEKHKIRHVLHWGTGMSDKKGLAAQDAFNNDPAVTVFASSDAGTYGLNLQAARYVINYEIPQSYDELMQRNSRIDRADSFLDGLTCYGYYCQDSIEERSYAIMEQRRELAEIIQGTREELSRNDIPAGLGKMDERTEIDFLLGPR